MMFDVLIIGGGQAGSMTAINLRKQKYEGSIAIITEERHHPYQRPLFQKAFYQDISNKKVCFLSQNATMKKTT